MTLEALFSHFRLTRSTFWEPMVTKRVNHVFELLGRTAEELLLKPFTEFIHPDDHAATLTK